MLFHIKVSILLLLCSFLLALEHEKSFLVQNEASNVYAVAVYGESLLLTSTNDIVQKSITTGQVERTFRAHSNRIYSFVLTNDSRMITSSLDANIIVWSMETGSILRRIWLGYVDAMVKWITLSNDQIFAGCTDSKVRHVNLATGRIVRSIDVFSSASSIVVDDIFIFVGRTAHSEISKIHIPSGGLAMSLDGHKDPVYSLAIHQKRLFSGSVDRSIICWNSVNGAFILEYIGHTDVVYVVSVFNNELYTGGRDAMVIKWSINDGQLLKVFPENQPAAIRCFDFTDQSIYSGADDATVVQMDLSSGLSSHVYGGRNQKLRSVVAWKNYIISSGEDSKIRLWDSTLNSIAESYMLVGHERPVNCLAIYEGTLFSGDSDAIIRQWNLTDLSNLSVLIGHNETVMTLHVDQYNLFSGGRDNIVLQWSVLTLDLMAQFRQHSFYVASIQVQGDLLFSGSFDFTAIKWSVSRREVLAIYSVPGEINVLCLVGNLLIVGSYGFEIFLVSTGETLLSKPETTGCYCIVSSGNIVFTGHEDTLIRSRELNSLNIVGTFQGHRDFVMSLYLNEFGVLFSASFDGSMKRWNMASRRIAFSFENRNDSVTSFSAAENMLFVGTKSGIINSFNIENGFLLDSIQEHRKEVTSMFCKNGYLFSSGADGKLLRFDYLETSLEISTVYNVGKAALKGLASFENELITIRGDREIIVIQFNNSFDAVRTISASIPILCIATSKDLIFSGAKSGEIFAWNFLDFQLAFELKRHTAQVNSLVLKENYLYSSSDDKTIIQWSLQERITVRDYKRSPATTLGHLDAVNSISLCDSMLFSGGSDLTVRAWNTANGKHEDVYFGFSLSVTNVLCLNGSVFAGSEDFSVLRFKPNLIEFGRNPSTANSMTASRQVSKTTRAIRKYRLTENGPVGAQIQLVLVVLSCSILVVILTLFYYLRKKRRNFFKEPLQSDTGAESSTTVTDLQTVINSVMGISKHAAYIINHSSIAKVRKLTAGGGGELYLAKLMEASLSSKYGNDVIQKIVFIKGQATEEAFFQEVGIMITMSKLPHICQIIGYTEQPASIILKYYPDGSLFDWLRGNQHGNRIMVKIIREVSLALNSMHSHYLAHCDLKSQNILVEVVDGVPSCFLTDFGITQVLSLNIVASKMFNVTNLRGLSVHYASPEAFRNFRSKRYDRVDFRMYDIYSLGCLKYEIMMRKAPWR